MLCAICKFWQFLSCRVWLQDFVCDDWRAVYAGIRMWQDHQQQATPTIQLLNWLAIVVHVVTD